MQSFFSLVLKNFLLINIALLLPVLIFGMIFSLLKSRCNQYIRGTIGYFGTLIFGIIGVPIHELSHLFMCLIFRHKVTEVSLFRPIKGRYDNTLGYVKHTYNTRSLYQKVGCFFIGIAPMLFGSLIIVYIINISFPSLITNMHIFPSLDSINIVSLASTVFYNGTTILKTIIAPSRFSNVYYWISIYLLVTIALHMTISRADFDNALSGFAILQVIIILSSLIIVIVSPFASIMISSIESISSMLFLILFIASIIFLLVFMIASIIYRITN